MQSTNRPRFPRTGPARVSNREQLSQRRRKNAIRLGGAALAALFACWILLRAEPAAPFHRVAEWFAGAFGSANTLAKSDADAREPTAAVGARRPPAIETFALRAAPPRDELRARSGADLGGPELAAEASGGAAERTARVQNAATVQNVAAAPPAAPAPVKPAEPAPTEPAPVVPVPDEPSAPGPGDVLGGLVPSDFDGSLGVDAAVGGIQADVATNVDVDLDEGSAAVDTGVRVDAPAAPALVGTQIAVSPGGADVGANLAVGPAPVATQISVAPGSVGTTVGAVGADIRLDSGAGSGLGTAVSLQDAGVPVSVALDLNDGDLAVDAGAGGVTAPVGQLLDTVPIDLPIRLH